MSYDRKVGTYALSSQPLADILIREGSRGWWC